MSNHADKESIVIKDESSPLGIFLVKSGSKGDRLLFRYPFEYPDTTNTKKAHSQSFDSNDAFRNQTNNSTFRTSLSNSSLNSSTSNLIGLSERPQERRRNPYALIYNEDHVLQHSHHNVAGHHHPTSSSHHHHHHGHHYGHHHHGHHHLHHSSVGGPGSHVHGHGVGGSVGGGSGPNVIGPGGLPNPASAGTRNQNVLLCAEIESFYRAQQPELNLNKRTDELIDASLRNVIEMPDKLLSNLFAVKSDLCGNKFELKINEVRFVSHPVLLSSKNHFQPTLMNNSNTDSNTSGGGGGFTGLQKQTSANKDKHYQDREKDLVTFNVVFALRANASQEIVKCYHDCSKRIAIALHFEEQRVGYLTAETKIMTAHDDELHDDNQDETIPYANILQKSGLARILRKMYEDLSRFGALYLRINSWIEVSFCLPQKVHKLTLKYHEKIPLIDPSEIQRSLESLRPYHGILLLVDARDLFDTLPLDAAPALVRVIQVLSPIKNLMDVSADADVSLTQVFHIVAQLVYWAKATIIYPLCENNIYMINPLAPLAVDSPLVKKFSKEFPNSNLLSLLSEFSFGISISQLRNPMLEMEHQTQLVQKIIWLLKHRLLLQVHTYVYLIPNNCPLPYLTKRPCTQHSSVTSSHTLTSADASSSAFLESQPLHSHSQHNQHHHHHHHSHQQHQLQSGKANVSIEKSDHTVDLSVDSGSSFASENESLATSPVRFHGKLSVVHQAPLISSSYPQQHGFAGSSLFDSNSFENSYSSSYNQNAYIPGPDSIPETSVVGGGGTSIGRLAGRVHSEQSLDLDHHAMDTSLSVRNVTGSLLTGMGGGAGISSVAGSARLIRHMAGDARDLLSTGDPTSDVFSSTMLQKYNSDDEDFGSNDENGSNFLEEDRLAMLLEAGLSKADCECILNLLASKNLDDLRLFAQLCGHFDGRHHLEDIMYYANVRRSQLLALIDKFREVLITVQHEDPAVAHLCPFNQGHEGW